ncbi:uncharacterized serine-rich protein C215.13-like, partial [Lucilia sericata]|uniref:uncharacterized serine-rich protein C215.13-like n=1 Tax=Lucilia sericata TaxID=13632 RepID=UPI0018A82F56
MEFPETDQPENSSRSQTTSEDRPRTPAIPEFSENTSSKNISYPGTFYPPTITSTPPTIPNHFRELFTESSKLITRRISIRSTARSFETLSISENVNKESSSLSSVSTLSSSSTSSSSSSISSTTSIQLQTPTPDVILIEEPVQVTTNNNPDTSEEASIKSQMVANCVKSQNQELNYGGNAACSSTTVNWTHINITANIIPQSVVAELMPRINEAT